MTIADAKLIDMKISETSSNKTYIFTDGSYEATIEDLIILLERLEDEEDIHEGLKALADEAGTITWEQYQRKRAE